MKKKVSIIIFFIILILAIILLLFKCRSNDIVSTFTHGDEDWKVTGDVKNEFAKPDFNKKEGHPDGCITATDETTGGVWYWSAPDKFLGHKQKAKRIKYEMKQSSLDNQFDDADIILESKDIRLVYMFPYHPDTVWTSFSADLTSEKGWKKDNLNGGAATKEDIRKVLSDLTGLKIRGEYVSGSDYGSLDNVVLKMK